MKQTVAYGALAVFLMSSAAMAASGQQPAPHMPTTGDDPAAKKALDMTKTEDPTPSGYAVLPLARGQKKEVTKHELIGDAIKGKDGKEIGKLEQLIMDTRTGKIEYGVVRFKDTNEVWPLHWNSFNVKGDGSISLNTTREQLRQRSSLDDAKDLSPNIKELVRDMRKNMGDTSTKLSPADMGEHANKDRGEAGMNIGGQAIEPGEGEQTGRPGTVFGGPASLPPQDEAVQFEGEGKSGKAGEKQTGR